MLKTLHKSLSHVSTRVLFEAQYSCINLCNCDPVSFNLNCLMKLLMIHRVIKLDLRLENPLHYFNRI